MRREEGRAFSPEEWARRARFECLVVVAVDALIMGGIYFALIGSALNDRSWSVYGYVFMFVPLLSVLAPVSVITGARLAHLRGKWEARDNGTNGKVTRALMPPSPWRWVAILGLPLGVIAASLVSLILWLAGAPRISPFVVASACLVAAAMVGVAVLARHLEDYLVGFAGAMGARESAANGTGPLPPIPRQRSLRAYYLKGYALPWVAVAMVLASSFGVKGAKEEALRSASSAAGVGLFALGANAVLTFFLIAAWTFHEAQAQARPDAYLGLRGRMGDGKRDKTPSVPSAAASLVLASLGAGALLLIPLRLAGVSALEVPAAVAIDLAVCVGAALAGSYGGMRWGMAREAWFYMERESEVSCRG